MADYRGKISRLINAMIIHESGEPQRAGHFLKVYGYAKAIGELTGLPETVLLTLEAAAVVHDIGIKPSLTKYGSGEGRYQEREGPPLARVILGDLGFSTDVIERVAYLVGRHHTYTEIDGMDYQILLEADYLVNMHEGSMPTPDIKNVYENIFKTSAGKRFCEELYLNDHRRQI